MAMHLCRNVCARLRGIARPGPVAAVAPQGARSFFSRSYLASEGFKEKYINGYMWVLAFLFGITVLKVKKGLKAMKEDMKSMRIPECDIHKCGLDNLQYSRADGCSHSEAGQWAPKGRGGTTYAEIMEAYERDKQRFRG
ncbi:hypothetical protein OROHE_010176 [Orobanche hederae]